MCISFFYSFWYYLFVFSVHKKIRRKIRRIFSDQRFVKNRVAAVCVIRTFFVRPGLGAAPQQAEKALVPQQRFECFFVFVGTHALLASYACVYIQALLARSFFQT